MLLFDLIIIGACVLLVVIFTVPIAYVLFWRPKGLERVAAELGMRYEPYPLRTDRARVSRFANALQSS